MRTNSRRAGRAAVARAAIASVGVSLVLAGAAVAARSGAYTGRTSQGQPVSFSISRGAVHSFKIVINDKCPDGHILSVTAGYPQMSISKGTFGGSFKRIGGLSGERATLTASVGASKVTGSLSDASYSTRERRLCHGAAKFTARHV